MGSVTSIKRDGIVKDLRKADPAVVKTIERLLKDAKSGEIVGIAGAVCKYDMLTEQFSIGVASYATVGRLHSAANHQIKLLRDGT